MSVLCLFELLVLFHAAFGICLRVLCALTTFGVVWGVEANGLLIVFGGFGLVWFFNFLDCFVLCVLGP